MTGEAFGLVEPASLAKGRIDTVDGVFSEFVGVVDVTSVPSVQRLDRNTMFLSNRGNGVTLLGYKMKNDEYINIMRIG